MKDITRVEFILCGLFIHICIEWKLRNEGLVLSSNFLNSLTDSNRYHFMPLLIPMLCEGVFSNKKTFNDRKVSNEIFYFPDC